MQVKTLLHNGVYLQNYAADHFDIVMFAQSIFVVDHFKIFKILLLGFFHRTNEGLSARSFQNRCSQR